MYPMVENILAVNDQQHYCYIILLELGGILLKKSVWQCQKITESQIYLGKY